MVDVVGGLRVEVAERVVADRREVQHRVEAVEVGGLDVADVLAQRGDPGRRVAEHAVLEQVRVEPDDVVAGPLEERDQHRADVAVVAGDEYAQQNLRTGECSRPSNGRARPELASSRVSCSPVSQGTPALSVGLAVRNGRTWSGDASNRSSRRTSPTSSWSSRDNVSDDGTVALLEDYARSDPRIRFTSTRSTSALHENMKRVLELSRGRYFRWISADDWLEPGCLSACVRALESRPEAIGVDDLVHDPHRRRIVALRGIPR